MKFISPVYNVKAVPVEKVVPNTYNPNSVAPPELKLLYDSIKEDGYTMPIVCYYSQKDDLYVIVDGFHRYRVMIEHKDIYERENGMLPVSVIDMTDTAPAENSAGRKVQLRGMAVSIKPRVLGPTSRMSRSRQNAAISRSIAAPWAPVSLKPALITTTRAIPISAHS